MAKWTEGPHTFRSKSERKRYRKSLRATVANKLVDRDLNRQSREKFYRQLRQVKLNRRALVVDLQRLATELDVLVRDVSRTHHQFPGSNPALVSAAEGMSRKARASVDGAIAGAAAFARKPVLRAVA